MFRRLARVVVFIVVTCSLVAAASNPGSVMPDTGYRKLTTTPALSAGLDPAGLQAIVTLDPVPLDTLEETYPFTTDPNCIGVVRELPGGTLPVASWEKVDGGRVLRRGVRIPGTASLRLKLTGMDLPDGVEAYVYGVDGEKSPLIGGPYTGRGTNDEGFMWTNTVVGDTIILEVFAKESVFPQVRDLEGVPDAEAVTDNMLDSRNTDLNCHLDYRCYSAWQQVGTGVGRMRYVRGGGSFVCTGSLINDNDPGTSIPYFLSAWHCLNTESSANTLEVWWNYNANSCNSSQTSVGGSTLGADYLAGQSFFQNNDFAFFRLTGQVPGGVQLLGWTTNRPGVGTEGTAIHHPAGDYKRMSFFNITNQNARFTESSSGITSTSNYYRADTKGQGATEGGSSGSALFNSSGQIIGQLWGGGGGCVGRSFYGRFEDTYPLIQTYIEGSLTPTPIPSGNDLCSGASSITLGATQNGNLTELSDETDFWSLTLADAGTYTVVMQPSSGNNFNLEVYDTCSNDTANTVLGRSTSGFDNPDSVTFTSSANNAVFLRVFQFQGSGSYTLSIARETTPTPVPTATPTPTSTPTSTPTNTLPPTSTPTPVATATPTSTPTPTPGTDNVCDGTAVQTVQAGDRITDSLADDDSQDYLRLNAQVGDRYRVTLQPIFGANYDMSIYERCDQGLPAGLIAFRTEPGSAAETIEFQATTTTPLILVQRRSGAGNYVLEVELISQTPVPTPSSDDVCNGPDVTLLGVGVLASDAVSASDTRDYFRYVNFGSSEVDVILEPSVGLDVALSVFDGCESGIDGNLLGNSDTAGDADEVIRFRPSFGTFYVRVDRVLGEGAYDITVRPVVPPTPTPSPTPPVWSGPIEPGWNTFGLPLDLGATFTASDFISYAASNAGVTVPFIARMDGGAWEVHAAGTGLNDFALMAGEGYYFYAEEAGTLTLPGSFLGAVTVPVGPGWSLVSMPAPIARESAAALCGSLSLQSFRPRFVVGWDGGYRIHPCGMAMNDFPTEAGRAYLIFTESGGSWTP